MNEQINKQAHEQGRLEFDGSWERAHRDVTVAAFLGLLIIGVVYFYAQTVITGVLVFINGFREHVIFRGKTFIEQISHSMMVIKNPVRYSIVISQFLFMLLPTFWIIKRWHTVHVLSYIRLVRFSFIELFLAVAATICFVPVSGCISEFFIRQLNFPDFLAQINAQIFTSYSRKELLWLIIVVCITPAICEEILFRGYLQRTLERTLGMKSLFITGIIFGLYHMQPLNLVSLSLLGIMIGYFCYRSKSVVPCIGAHFTNNLLSVLSLYKTSNGHTVIDVFDFQITFMGVVVALMFAVGLLFAYHHVTVGNFE